MANFITHLMVVTGSPEAVKAFFDKIILTRTDEGDGDKDNIFNFNAVVPMPEELNIESSSSIEEFIKTGIVPAFIRPENRDVFLAECEQAKQNIEKYGFKDWYDWRRAKWGTKWNGFHLNVLSEDTIMFDTAWSTPMGIWYAIAEQFPELQFNIKYADEDSGYNAGEIDINSGELEHYEPIGGSDEAWSLYFETHPEMEEEYVYVKGKGWTYYEDVEEGDETE